MSWWNPSSWFVKPAANAYDAAGDPDKWPGADRIRGAFKNPGEEEQRAGLTGAAGAAGSFAGVGEGNYGNLTSSMNNSLRDLRDIASGRNSVTAEQLRQSLGQNLSAQRSMAASASPQNASMAALMASRNAMNLGSGLAGQQALAGMQERQAAQQALAQMMLGMRGQDAQVALGSRQNEISGYGGITPGKSTIEKFGGMVQSGAQMYTAGKGKPAR